LSLKSIIQKQTYTLSLVITVLIALALRLYHLDFQGLWVDEIASMNGTDPEMSWKAVITYSVTDQPPAFFLLLHGWFKLFPFNDFYGRLLSVLVGILGIISIFFLGKEIKDGQTGLLGALITTFSFIHILLSQEVRFYTLLFLFSSLSYLFLIRAVKYSRITDFILYTASTAVVIYTHYFGLVIFASQGCIFVLLIAFYPADRRFIIRSIVSALITIILVSPWIPIFASDAQIQDFWIQSESFYFPIRYFYVYFKDVIASFLFAFFIILYFVGQYKKIKNGPLDKIDLILICWPALCFLIPVIYSIIQTPLLQVRYTLIALPAIIVLICLGLQHLKPQFQKILIVITCCSSFFSLVIIEKYYTKSQKEDWRGMIKLVIEHSSANDQIVSGMSWYCNYYFKTYDSPLRAIPAEQFNTENKKPPGVWWLDGFKLSPVPDAQELNLLQQGYFLKQTDSLFRARASYYQLR